ncbi:MAG: HAD-IA family hydrolase [Microbacterium sp.]
MGMSSGRRIVFWDFDGTLARRDGLFAGAVADALRMADPASTLTRDDVYPHLRVGFPWHSPEVVVDPPEADEWWWRIEGVFARAYAELGVSPGTAAAAIPLIRGEFLRPDSWRHVDGAVEALETTRAAGYENVALSNHAPELPELVEALGLSPYHERVITSAAVGAEKPNPAIFEYALRVTDASDDVWMVGDNPRADVAGAEAVGIRAILADKSHPDPAGVSVLEAAQLIAAAPEGTHSARD